MTHLVDSDRLIDYFHDAGGVRAPLQPLARAGRLATSIVVVAELYEGAVGSPDADALIANLQRDLSGVTVLGLDDETAQRFAEIRSNLRRQGQIIGDHDIWIAATALQHDLTLITRDTHFQRIPMLKIDALAAQ